MDASKNPRKVIITKKKSVPGKSFRLIDFHVYDENVATKTSSSASSDEESVSSSGKGNAMDQYYETPDDFYAAQQEVMRNKQSKIVTPKFTIQMYGINEKGETCSIFVNDYQPFFYVLVEDNWTKAHCKQFQKELAARLGKLGEASIVSVELAEYNKLYGFTAGKQSKFARIVFHNTATMMRVRGFWYEWVGAGWEGGEGGIGAESKGTRRLKPLISQGCILDLYESKLPPLLRYFHINNISPSGWVFLPINRMNVPTETITTCMYEYICGVKDIIPQPQKETRVPYKICSFDIEASSSHGDFPIPIKTYKRLVMQMIDVFRMQTNNVDIGKDREQDLIKRMILASFGYGKFSDIDLVYPKGTMPSKKHLETVLIPELLTYSFANVMSGDASSNGGAISIEAMFERMKENSANGGNSGNGGDEDGGDDGEGGDEDNEEIVLDVEDLDDPLDQNSSNSKKVSSITSKHASGKNTKPAVINKKIPTKTTCIQAPDITILDILKTDKHSRDEKIQWINQVLSDPDTL